MKRRLQSLLKSAALMVALFAISLNVNAQEWYVMGEYIWSPPHPQGTYMELHYQAETVAINGLEYNTIYIQGQGVLLGAYRNEDNQVYYCKWNGASYDDEVLLYDYDLEEGDFFNDDDEHPMQVIEVSTVVDNQGVERKKLTFSFIGLEDETEYWIEGVGSNKGFVNAGNYTPTEDGAIFHLLCYHVDNAVIYVNPTYDTCDIDAIEEDGAESNLSLYPNPACGHVKVMNNDHLTITSIEVIDLFGRSLMRVENSDTVDVSKLANGQYFLRINAVEGAVVRKLSVLK